MGSDIQPSDELLKKIIAEEVSEETIYADVFTCDTTIEKAVADAIPDGYYGIVMGVAVSRDETITLFLKRKDKQVYANGLNTAGLSDIAQSAGVGREVFLGVLLQSKDAWELGFKASAGTPKVNYRIRIRLYKKGA